MFKKGIIIGGLLATAAALGYAMSKEGRELTKELKEDLKPLVRRLKKNINKLQDVTKEELDGLVDSLVDEYAKKKEISDDSKRTLVQTLKSRWYDMDKEYSREE